MKRICTVLLCVLLLSSCDAKSFLPISTEINQMSIIQMIAIDKDGDDIKVTLSKRDISDTSSESSEQSSGDQQSSNDDEKEKQILSAKGNTLSEALRKLQKLTDKKLFFGDLEYFFLGESAAKDGIKKYVDYLFRGTDFNMNSFLYITEGSAADLVKKSSQKSFFLPDYLEIFLDDYSLQTSTTDIDVMNILADIYDPCSSTSIPSIKIKEDGDSPKIEVSGYWIFHDKELICRLTGEDAVGFNIINGEFSGYIMSTENDKNRKISLSVIKQKCNIKPVFENGKLKKVTIKCSVESNIIEDHSSTDYSDKSELKKVEEKQKEIIRSKMEKCMVTLIQDKADAISLCQKVRTTHNSFYEQNKDSWREVFAETPFEISVKSKVSRTYNSREEDE